MIAILTEGGRQRGFGHLSRCQSLAQAFAEQRLECQWWVRGDETARDYLGVACRSWDDDVPELRDCRVALVDSYEARPETLWRLAERVECPVFLDDFRYLEYPRGLVVDWTVLAEQKRQCALSALLGARYAALREPFWQVLPRLTAGKPRRLLLTLGGSDVRGLLPRLTPYLVEAFPSWILHAVVGPGFQPPSALRGCNLLRNLNAAEMRGVMLESDLAVSAGGQTLYELAAMGTPVVSVSVAENAALDEAGFCETGFSLHAGSWQDEELATRVIDCLRQLVPASERSRRAGIGQGLVDGQGARRVVREILDRC